MGLLSLTLSLLAVLHAAHIGLKGFRKLDARRKALKALERLWSELESLEVLLENVRIFH